MCMMPARRFQIKSSGGYDMRSVQTDYTLFGPLNDEILDWARIMSFKFSCLVM